MKIYKVEAVILGNNDKPEARVERIIAGGWQEAHELMARICRDTGCVITEMHIIETDEGPFDFRTVKAY
jgi:hypothetical protein